MKISNILDLYRGQGSSSSTQLKNDSATTQAQAQKSTEAVKVDPSLSQSSSNSDRTQYLSDLKAKIDAGEYNPSSTDVATALLYGR